MTGAPKPFGDFLREHPIPDLAQLAAAHGGLVNVPPEAWDDYRSEVRAWRDRLRLRHEEGR